MLFILVILTLYSQFIQFDCAFMKEGEQRIKVKRNLYNAQSEIRYSRVSEKKCKEYQAPIYDKWEERNIFTGEHEIYYTERCPHVIQEYIVGGSEAKPKEFPHMALIGSSKLKKPWVCGGSLISDQFVLTAAHCNKDIDIDKIRLGELDYDKIYDDANQIDFGIIQIIIHEDYNKDEAYNDIALYKLDRKVDFTRHIRPACLSTELNDCNSQYAIATGWGSTYPGEGSYLSPFLKKLVLEIVDYDECNTDYKKIKDDKTVKKLPKHVHNISQICYGSRSGDTCTGDSGGPLQIYHRDLLNYSCMYSIIGITSVGYFCGHQFPGIYTRVYYYLDWIEEKVWPNEKL